jgi:transcriptional regulator with XRE-family HTH domain
MQDQQEFYRAVRWQLRTVRRQLGAVLHQRRQMQGVTLRRLAELTGLSADRLDRLELGKDTLDLVTVARVAVALKVELNHLLAGRL